MTKNNEVKAEFVDNKTLFFRLGNFFPTVLEQSVQIYSELKVKLRMSMITFLSYREIYNIV